MIEKIKEMVESIRYEMDGKSFCEFQKTFDASVYWNRIQELEDRYQRYQFQKKAKHIYLIQY